MPYTKFNPNNHEECIIRYKQLFVDQERKQQKNHWMKHFLKDWLVYVNFRRNNLVKPKVFLFLFKKILWINFFYFGSYLIFHLWRSRILYSHESCFFFHYLNPKTSAYSNLPKVNQPQSLLKSMWRVAWNKQSCRHFPQTFPLHFGNWLCREIFSSFNLVAVNSFNYSI